jgi:hypothetical protein
VMQDPDRQRVRPPIQDSTVVEPIGDHEEKETNLSRRCSGVRPSPPFLELGFLAAARSRSRSLWLPRAPPLTKSRTEQDEEGITRN